jgi:hypothetical protein
MQKKIYSLTFIVIFILVNGNITAQAQSRTVYPTDWKVVNKSFTELLNDGWIIVGQNYHRITTSTQGGGIGFDESRYVYTIFKNGKYITCFLEDPRIEGKGGASSACRLLN